MEMSVNDNATRRPTQFMADLTQAMSATAEAARQATIDQCRTDAEAHLEQLRSGQEDDTVAMRKAAEADVAAIREWSKAQMDRTRAETEDQIALRRRQLEGDLAEYDAAIETELHRVGEQIEAWEADLAVFFERLLEDSDPATVAAMAAQMPDPPVFDEPDPGSIVRSIRAANGEGPAGGGPDGRDGLPDHWWLESPAALAARARSMAGSSRGS
jgi:hypothetical protein